MKKRLTAMVLIITVLFSLTSLSALAVEKPISVYFNNELLTFDVSPKIIDGRTMVPMRVIFEKLGANVTWDESTNTAHAYNYDERKGVSVTVGLPHMLDIYRNIIPLDVPAIIDNNRTLIPLRAVSEAFGCKVEWDGTSQIVRITTNDFVDFSKETESQSVIEAANVKEFLEAIGNNTKIVLTSDYYNLSEVTDANNDHLEKQVLYLDSPNDGYIIKNIVNLTIEGNAKIVIDDIWSDVLNFRNCGNITLSGLTVGHTDSLEEYRCEGAVTNFTNCINVNIDMCNLFGCGAFGIYATGVKNLKVTNSKIYDCSYTGIWLTGNSNADVIKTEFSDSTLENGFLRIDNSVINCTDCVIRDIVCKGSGFLINNFDSTIHLSSDGDKSVITISDSTFSNNIFDSIRNSSSTKLVFNNCTFENNDGDMDHDSVIYNNCNIR